MVIVHVVLALRGPEPFWRKPFWLHPFGRGRRGAGGVQSRRGGNFADSTDVKHATAGGRPIRDTTSAGFNSPDQPPTTVEEEN